MKKVQILALTAAAVQLTLVASACQILSPSSQPVSVPTSQESIEPDSADGSSSIDVVPQADAICAAIQRAGMGDAVGGELTIFEPSEDPGASACVGYVDGEKKYGIAMAVVLVDGPARVSEYKGSSAYEQDPELGDAAFVLVSGKVIVLVSGNLQVSMNIDSVDGDFDVALEKVKFIAFLDELGIKH
jgi:hypothetical protein